MFQAAAGREPLFLDFEVVRPLLFLLPSHVAARLLFGRVDSLRLGSGGVHGLTWLLSLFVSSP